MKYIILLSTCLILASCVYKSADVQGYKITSGNIKSVANLIYLNETGGNRDNLLFWSPKEPFPSLGIGHFIWYPKTHSASFGHSLPSLIAFYKSKDIVVPKLLETEYAPWNSKEEFERFKITYPDLVEEIIAFFEKTKHIQAEFMVKRIIDSFNNIVVSSKDKTKVIYQFNRIMNEKNGVYLIIDYINFKGEGATAGPTYGLRAVLENMTGSESGNVVFLDFANACKDVLTTRIYNSTNHSEIKFLPGWMRRCNSYILQN